MSDAWDSLQGRIAHLRACAELQREKAEHATAESRFLASAYHRGLADGLAEAADYLAAPVEVP